MYHSEEFELDYKTLDELSYWDTQEPFVRIYKNNLLQGYVEVWTDYGNDNREYIIINNEIVYLDNLKQK